MNENLKIIYLLPGGLFNSGGMERVVSLKASYLADKAGYDVSIVTTEQMGRPVFYPLSDKVKLYHLDIGIHENFGRETYIEKCRSRYHKKKEYRIALERLLMEIRPDITITTLGGLDIDFIGKFKDGSVKIGELHFPGNYRELMARKLSRHWFPRMVGKYRSRAFDKKCRRLSRLVVLTDEEKSLWEGARNVEVIPNPLPFFPETISLCEEKRAVAIGRLEHEKGFDSLIRIWKIVSEKQHGWRLDIYGSGSQKKELLYLIRETGQENMIRIYEPVEDIQTVYQEHSIFLFSSRYLEALPMVLIEAMSCGLPVVAFSASCGPRDIMEGYKNGFLVEPENKKAFSKRVLELIESDELRKEMGSAARESSKRYCLDSIMGRWISLFEALLGK